MRKYWLSILTGCILVANSYSQKPQKPTSSEIFHEIQKLNFLGTVLYVAAHPDDENTRLISYLSNHVKARTVYLSLTRGDGGQNLIGPELRELLGILRTQELLAARNVDGGEQWFSRANDFGYSKNPKETLEIWDKDDILGDVIWAIRNLKPDVIINRFDHRSSRPNHGHHTASAMLSMEAFDLVNDRNSFSDQLKWVDTWQPKRIFFNTSWWFYGGRENFKKVDKSNMLKFDIGVYYPNLGLSNNEIAAIASSQHLCQGFGRLSSRGSQEEYIELLKGDMPTDKMNIFEGIDTSWSRIKGGEKIGKILYAIENNFDFKNPASHLPKLFEAYGLIRNIEDAHWKSLKMKHLEDIILACGGIYLEAGAKRASANPGEEVTIDLEVLSRSNTNILLESVSIANLNENITPEIVLKENKKENLSIKFTIPNDHNYTSAYWLKNEGSLGMYKVNEQKLIGKPETPTPFIANFILSYDEIAITFEKPIVYRYSKPDKGELYEPFVVLPSVTVNFQDDVVIFADSKSKTIPLTIKAGKENINGSVSLELPDGWNSSPKSQSFSINKKGEELNLTFQVTPPKDENEGEIKAHISINNQLFSNSLVEIEYDHIPKQSVLFPATSKIVRLNIQKSGEHIGYIVGAGDKVPESLEQIGYQVHAIDVSSIQEGSLDKFDGIVVGIRAYNVNEALKLKQKYLLEYVKNGGNLIIQYNTSGRWGFQMDNLAPYKLRLSRDRVTDENAAVEILAKEHSLVNFPNQITQKDFEGWVQERGLYFPSEWGNEFTPILSMNDEGESPKKGSLLVAPYGKGNYIYTGLSFFRELPAGVSGAFKLFANMLSVGKDKVETYDDVKG